MKYLVFDDVVASILEDENRHKNKEDMLKIVKALALATFEVLWITYLLKELQIPLLQTPVLNCDNKSAEALANNPRYHSKTENIELGLHFV